MLSSAAMDGVEKREGDGRNRRCAVLALSLLLLWKSGTHAQDLRLGQAVYQQECAPCHGELYNPSGPMDESEPWVDPPYYAGHRYLLNVSPESISRAVVYGVTGTGMIGQGSTLSDEQLESLIAYIEYFRRP